VSENLELVRRALRRFSEQDIDGMVEEAHSKIEIDYSESDAPDARVYRGHAGCRAFLRGRYEDFETRSFETVELIDVPPSAVVAVGRMRGTGRGSGVAVEARSVTVWTLRDGKIEHIKFYRSRAEAFERLGLPEDGHRQTAKPT
jgi:ketosteroid isomerase-like protein